MIDTSPRRLEILRGEVSLPARIQTAVKAVVEGKPLPKLPHYNSGIGSRLKAIAGRLSLGSTCGSCDDEASYLDSRTPIQVEKEIDAIATRIFNRRDKLEGLRGWLAKMAGDIAPTIAVDCIKTAIISCLHPKIRPNPFTPGRSRKFVSIEDYGRDIQQLASMVPSDVTLIAGVSRSGLYAATMVAMLNQLPMVVVRQSMNDIIPAGNGWRLNSGAHTGRVMVIDDTCFTGNSQSHLTPLLNKEYGSNWFWSTVYRNPNANLSPALWVSDLEWPHILEWNFMNSILSPNMALDFDGILCPDCSMEQDDDGPRYLDFIENTQPLYINRRCPIPLIVTARLEKYREPTLAWLAKHGMSVDRLVMHPARTLAERNSDDIAKYKAGHYADWAKSHRPFPPPNLFVESDDAQAKRIAQITGLSVVCPSARAVY